MGKQAAVLEDIKRIFMILTLLIIFVAKMNVTTRHGASEGCVIDGDDGGDGDGEESGGCEGEFVLGTISLSL